MLLFFFFAYLDEEINTLEKFRKERVEGISGQTNKRSKNNILYFWDGYFNLRLVLENRIANSGFR